ncbi:MAG: hypothetical protein DRI71_01650 [Bacteroidetes bacterium]|nr:MAG: hypothetical protein DRI71_01650 [Bacteroidota bacterium]
MKKISILTLSITALLLSSFSGCDTETIEPEADLVSVDENLGLVYMREEEKLARDVYITMYEMYDNKIFNNISKAEQMHMDKVLTLLEKYNIEDPSFEGIGEFSNETLQQLYNDLIELGSKSEIDALLVGVTIEDVDIFDLDEFTVETTDPDIIAVYDALNCGSRNHMRAFNAQLDSLGVTYTPQFITQEQFDAIIAGDHERCGQN